MNRPTSICPHYTCPSMIRPGPAGGDDEPTFDLSALHLSVHGQAPQEATVNRCSCAFVNGDCGANNGVPLVDGRSSQSACLAACKKKQAEASPVNNK